MRCKAETAIAIRPTACTLLQHYIYRCKKHDVVERVAPTQRFAFPLVSEAAAFSEITRRRAGTTGEARLISTRCADRLCQGSIEISTDGLPCCDTFVDITFMQEECCGYKSSLHELWLDLCYADPMLDGEGCNPLHNGKLVPDKCTSSWSKVGTNIKYNPTFTSHSSNGRRRKNSLPADQS